MIPPLSEASAPASAKANSQSGFTLIELMLGTFLGLLLMLAVFGVLYQSIGMADVLKTQVGLNREARQIFWLVTNGGKGDENALAMPGLRGVNPSDNQGSNGETYGVTNASGRLQFSFDDGTDQDTLSSSRIAETTVNCRENSEPIETCVGTGTVLTQGHLANQTSAAQTSGLDRVSQVTIELINPETIGHAYQSDSFEKESFYFLSHHQRWGRRDN
ncbi:MAG: PulJ/GspJ family protein [Magnetovibrionaceae bacterium]